MPSTGRSTGRLAAWSRAIAAAARICVARSSEEGRFRSTLATPRSADADPRGGVIRPQRGVGAGGPPQGVSGEHSHTAAYAKGWEEIEGYLVAAGAIDSVLALEERSVVAEMRAEANRLANADHANLVRTARAALSSSRPPTAPRAAEC